MCWTGQGSTVTDDMLGIVVLSIGGNPARAQSLFCLAWFHAVCQERRNYIPQVNMHAHTQTLKSNKQSVLPSIGSPGGGEGETSKGQRVLLQLVLAVAAEQNK